MRQFNQLVELSRFLFRHPPRGNAANIINQALQGIQHRLYFWGQPDQLRTSVLVIVSPRNPPTGLEALYYFTEGGFAIISVSAI